MWKRPTDTGTFSGTLVPILYYRVEISENVNFSCLESNAVVNSSQAMIIYNHVFENLLRGVTYFVRAQVFTKIGTGLFSNRSNCSMAVDVPASPIIMDVGCGRSAESLYLKVLWASPDDTGVGPNAS